MTLGFRLVFLWLFLGATCLKAALPPGDHVVRLTHQEKNRWARVFVPTHGDTNTKLPLVVGLHGGGGNPRQFARVTGFEKLAQREGFLLATPAGTHPKFSRAFLTWNAGYCCGSARKEKVDDVGFLSKLLDELPKRVHVDPKRIYLMGHSNGAILTLKAAATLAPRLAAIASVAGSAGGSPPETKTITRFPLPKTPLPALFIHGRADTSVRWDGGYSGGLEPYRRDLSVLQTVKLWTDAMGCKNPVVLHGKTPRFAKTHQYLGCKENVSVNLIELPVHAHSWPGSTQRFGRIRKLLSSRSASVDPEEFSASVAIWEFFRTKTNSPDAPPQKGN